MWKLVVNLGRLSILLAVAVSLMGALPRQSERPPQPLFPDHYSGSVTIQDEPAPAGTTLLACIDSCLLVFQSQPVTIQPGGKYHLLEVNPSDEALIGRDVTFYLVNEFGRIQAADSRVFVGVYNFYLQDLNFPQGMPVPTPTPTLSPTPTLTPMPTLTPTAALPVTGDPTVTMIPKLALWIGAGAVVGGAALLLVARRRASL